MAAITKKEMYPNLGACWQRAVELWELYVVQPTWTITNSSATVDSSSALKVVINDTVDVTTYWLLPGDSMNGANLGHYFFGQSGWLHSPGPKEATYGARNTQTDFQTNMVSFRTGIYNFFCGDFAVGTLRIDTKTLPKLSASAKMFSFTWQERMNVGLDLLVCVVYTPAADYSWPLNRAGNEGVLPPALTVAVVGGGGGSTDMSGVVQAVEDLAHKTTVVSINGGQAIYAVESSEIVE